ncbi:MAG TPA: M48 family metallopeptidase, partial [Segetibacter sp.]
FYRSNFGLRHLIVLTFIICPGFIFAQSKNPYNYQELSHVLYETKKDSIKKTWTCPIVYKDKATQKLYKELWDGRVSFISAAIQDKDYIGEKEVYNYVEAIISQIVTANPQLIPVKPILFIDRSAAVNAYAIGGNIIAVNLGLISFANLREELAMVIAHELSHNILNHADNSIKERAEWFTSKEYENSLKAVLDSRYERLSRLKKVFEGYSFDRSKHSRYHENDADSLAIVLLKNADISYNPAFFLRLDSSDIQYKLPLQKTLKSYFTAYNLPIEDMWLQKRSKGLSTKSYNFKDTTSIEDSLKTHPECKDRYNKTLAFTSADLHESKVPSALKEKTNKMIIWNLFDNQSLTACLYRIFLEKDKGNTDEWYDFMVQNIFGGLYYSDKQLNRFNAIRVTQKEFICKDYYELQTMFEQMPKERIEQYCKDMTNLNFSQKLPSDAKALRDLLYKLNFDDKATGKLKEIAAKDFITNNSSSMFCEFADHFTH